MSLILTAVVQENIKIKLSPRTEYEERCVDLLEDFLDNYDYTGETKPVVTNELKVMLEVGLKRRFDEELEDWEKNNEFY